MCFLGIFSNERGGNKLLLPRCPKLATHGLTSSARQPIIIQMPLGLYIAVPFCRTKCTYCNFASDVFSRAMFEKYVERLCSEIQHSPENAGQALALLDRSADSIYLGGGTPTLLDVTQLHRAFVTIRQIFAVHPDAEITVECAPGTLSDAMLEELVECRVNRVSLGVQSFIDQEAASVGRMHKRQTVLNDIKRLRQAGITNITVDLIAGLPHQTRASWERSVGDLIATGAPHASVYMLEVDEDSRLGRELIAGGQKYHAHFVPDEDLTADLYESACDRLNAAGIAQYEISNFARPGFESKHNLKYWTRQPYLGLGVDAHSMLVAAETDVSPACSMNADHSAEAVRLANADSLEKYLSCEPPAVSHVNREAALEECLFLGLRLNRGVDLGELARQFGALFTPQQPVIEELVQDGLLEREGDCVKLSRRGRLLSNEVFRSFLLTAT
jgi:putative oxygen-independent coproporphyrinogen III oxidase